MDVGDDVYYYDVCFVCQLYYLCYVVFQIGGGMGYVWVVDGFVFGYFDVYGFEFVVVCWQGGVVGIDLFVYCVIGDVDVEDLVFGDLCYVVFGVWLVGFGCG